MTGWIDLARSQPLFAVCITVAAYAASEALWRRSGQLAFLNPVLVATGTVAGLLLVLGISHEEYFRQAGIIHETLALMIVLLAVPLCRQFWLVRATGWPICIALAIGSVVAIVSALAGPLLMGAEDALLATIAPKSATAPVAIEISDRLGGIPGMTAVVVISTGIFGASFGPMILETAGVRDDRAKGFALGLTCHGIGTARAFQISETAGTFASLGMILNALLTILLVPLVLAAL